MCLSSVERSYWTGPPLPKEPVECFKVMRRSHEYQQPYFVPPLMTPKVIPLNTRFIDNGWGFLYCDAYRDRYETGFHAFTNEADARRYLKDALRPDDRLVVVRCRLEELTAIGTQYVNPARFGLNSWEAPCVVGRVITILEVL